MTASRRESASQKESASRKEDGPRKEEDGGPFWRPLRRGDLSAVVAIADALHPAARERLEVFEEKHSLFPEGCFALQVDDAVAGYLISHPWRLGDVPPLDAFLVRLPDAPNCLYLHDIAIDRAARGHGCAAVAVDLLTAIARRRALGALALVALYGADALWERLGFTRDADAGLAMKMKGYGEGAVFMRKTIGTIAAGDRSGVAIGRPR